MSDLLLSDLHLSDLLLSDLLLSDLLWRWILAHGQTIFNLKLGSRGATDRRQVRDLHVAVRKENESEREKTPTKNTHEHAHEKARE